jgi:hypothetical protein
LDINFGEIPVYMIQRIQSLFLAVSVAISIASFVVPFGEKMDNDGKMHSLIKHLTTN